jgi:hypothetical protein
VKEAVGAGDRQELEPDNALEQPPGRSCHAPSPEITLPNLHEFGFSALLAWMSGVGRMLQRRSLLELADVDIVMLTLAADAVEAVGREVVGGEDAPHALAEDVLHAAASGMTDEGSADGRSGAGSSGAFTSKTAPGVVFATRQELADHNRSDWYVRVESTRSQARVPALWEHTGVSSRTAHQAPPEHQEASSGAGPSDRRGITAYRV